jgi:hypothetical protein
MAAGYPTVSATVNIDSHPYTRFTDLDPAITAGRSAALEDAGHGPWLLRPGMLSGRMLLSALAR